MATDTKERYTDKELEWIRQSVKDQMEKNRKDERRLREKLQGALEKELILGTC